MTETASNIVYVNNNGKMGEASHLSRKNDVPIWEKFCLTITEASMYFHIGDKKLRALAEEHADSGMIVQNGSKVLIKRIKFEEFLNETNSL